VPFRTVLRTLREPRFAALTALMILVALVCVGAGAWQVYRLDYKIRANSELRHNAHDQPAPVASILPLVGARAPGTHAIEYRPAAATGQYDAAHQVLVRKQNLDGRNGYWVLTPFDTTGGTLLVVRGFVAQPDSGGAPAVPPPPVGTVSIVTRIQPSQSASDEAAKLDGQVESVNASDQATRLGRPVFDGYGQLLGGQPGTSGLGIVPDPSLSNPAGGAVEPQHLAYVIQWFLFAFLALAAPVVMARSELRDRIGLPPPDELEAVEPSPAMPDDEVVRREKLTDRYGRVRRV
jgi:cytochrome oxidase assembly protein ShyY1